MAGNVTFRLDELRQKSGEIDDGLGIGNLGYQPLGEQLLPVFFTAGYVQGIFPPAADDHPNSHENEICRADPFYHLVYIVGSKQGSAQSGDGQQKIDRIGGQYTGVSENTGPGAVS